MASYPRPAPILVFDVGGTNVRGAVCDAASPRLRRTLRRRTWNFLTHPEAGADELLEGTLKEMRGIGRALTDDRPPAAVVVGWPGPIAPDGTVLRSPTVLGDALDRPVAVGASLARIWPRSPVAVLNDLTCAGYAYVGLGYRDFCVFTVGSGIANKVFVDGRPLLGPGGRGGEAGHLVAQLPASCPPGVVDPAAHLGDVASGRGTLRLGHRLAEVEPELFARSSLASTGASFDNEALVAAFRSGDAFACRVVALAADALAHAVAAVHVIVGTERIMLTGGFATALGEPYRRLLVAGAKRSCWELGQDWDTIVEIGEDVDGLVGGAVYAQRELLGGIRGNVA
jgi:glucokinase